MTASSSDSEVRPGDAHWFLPIARFLGPAYLRNAFTKGTEQEVEFLVDALGLQMEERVLDVGCGPGRHSLALACRGIDVLGVDLSPEFIELARQSALADELSARFVVGDVRELPFDSEFDAVICLCQGGFGLLGGRDELAVFERIVRAVRPGGRLALSAFSAAFALRHLEERESFDAATGVFYERAVIRGPEGDEREFDAWTTCFTARELELLAERAGLVIEGLHGVSPGRYGRTPVTLDDPELLLLGRRPG